MRRALFVLLLAGCASSQQDQCNAYEAGRADARFGKQPSYEAYARACSAQAAAADYMAGWSIGASETSFRQPN